MYRVVASANFKNTAAKAISNSVIKVFLIIFSSLFLFCYDSIPPSLGKKGKTAQFLSGKVALVYWARALSGTGTLALGTRLPLIETCPPENA
jgi:hypothetical protein